MEVVQVVLFIVVLIFSVVIHEVAHAWQARREGDDTAERLGRITLNPLPHLDLFGSFIVPVLLYVGSAYAGSTPFMFGWAKPVPVNPANYRDFRGGDIRVSLAGIVANLGLAVLSTLAAALVVMAGNAVGSLGGVTGVLFQMAQFGIWINLVLAFFNLIPIPPLDGSHVLFHLLPPSAAIRYHRAGRYGILIVIALLVFQPHLFDVLLMPVNWLMGFADSFVRLWI